jgi:hypothetical protein
LPELSTHQTSVGDGQQMVQLGPPPLAQLPQLPPLPHPVLLSMTGEGPEHAINETTNPAIQT